jgi:hypothetical protein
MANDYARSMTRTSALALAVSILLLAAIGYFFLSQTIHCMGIYPTCGQPPPGHIDAKRERGDVTIEPRI